MNILTRNVPRQYLRNGNLNLTGEGYSSFSYGLSGMTGGYLPALPLEEGGYLVEDPVTFMYKILVQGDTQIKGNTQIDGNLNVYGDSNLKNTNIDGDINLTGKIYVNGEEFKGGNDGESYLKDLKDVSYNWESITDTGLLYYTGTKWNYKSIFDIKKLIVTDLDDKLNESINNLSYTFKGVWADGLYTGSEAVRCISIDLDGGYTLFGDIIIEHKYIQSSRYYDHDSGTFRTYHNYYDTNVTRFNVIGAGGYWNYTESRPIGGDTTQNSPTVEIIMENLRGAANKCFEWDRAYKKNNIIYLIPKRPLLGTIKVYANIGSPENGKVTKNLVKSITLRDSTYGINITSNEYRIPLHSVNLKDTYGVSASADELNILDGALITTEEINHLQGSKSNIQGQIDTINEDLEGVHETLEDHENRIDILERNNTFRFIITEGNEIGFLFTPDPKVSYAIGEDVFNISLSTSGLSGHILASVYIGNQQFASAQYYCYGNISKYIKNIYIRNYHQDYQYPYYDAYGLHIIFDEQITNYFDDIYPLEMLVKATDRAQIYCEPDFVPPNFDKLKPELQPSFSERIYKLPIISNGSGDIEINNNKVLITNGDNSIQLTGNSIELLNKGEISVGNDNKQINITNDKITITDFVNEKQIDEKLNDLHVIIQDEITDTCKQFENKIDDKTNSWMIPLSYRMNNMEEQLGDIEILLDKILGYEANEYLNETLDEIIG